MEDTQKTIGMTGLLDEIDRDLDEFRRKHSGDYSVKNVTLWWELEKERLLVRHGPKSVVKKPRLGWLEKHKLVLFMTGAAMWLIGQVCVLLLRE